MKKILVVITALVTVSLTGSDNFLSLIDATGGAPTGFMMQAAIQLSLAGKMNLSMSRSVPSEALPRLERGEVDAVLIDSRFVRDLPHIPIAADALALYVSTANPATGLSKRQVLEILTAPRPNWKDYIHIDFDIQRITHPLDSNAGSLIRRNFGDVEISPEIFKVDSVSGGFAFVNTASIFFTRFSPQPPVEVKALTIDGVVPTIATVSDGTYPLAIRYVLVYKTLTPKLQALLFVLKQNQFRRIINDTGLMVLLEE